MPYKIAAVVADKDFAGDLIKVIEEINTSHANGTLRLASGERIDFLFGTPYHATAQDREGLDALDAVLTLILAGGEFAWDPTAEVDRDKATISLSSLRLISRIKGRTDTGKPAGVAPKAAAKAVAKPAAKVAPAKATPQGAATKTTMTLDLAMVAEKLPILPGGDDFPHDQNSVPAILYHLSSGVIDAISPSLRGLVVVVDGRLADAVAVVGDEFLQGPAALDAITLDAAKALNVRVLDAAVAAVIPFFWKLPVRVRDLQARWVGGATAVKNFIKPDAWGVLHIRSDEDTGLVFFSQGQVLLSYSQAHPTPSTDLSALQTLLGAESAIISARVEDEVAPAAIPAAKAPVTPPAPVSVPEPVPQVPAPVVQPPAPESAPVVPAEEPTEVEPELIPPVPPTAPEPVVVIPVSTPITTPPVAQEAPIQPAAPTPAPVPVVAPDATELTPAPSRVEPPVAPSTPPVVAPPTEIVPPWATAVPAEEPQLDASVRDRILNMIRSELKFHAPAIEAEFTNADLTRSGLLKAAKRVRAMRPRLISEERMESIGTRAINIITGREAA